MAITIPSAIHLDLLAPLSGFVVPLEAVPDPVFAQLMVGNGISIDPISADLLAPLAGTISQLHPAHHALTITSHEGVEVLIHIGLDTVMLKGEGFSPKVRLGDRVEAGQLLISFDPILVGRRARSLLTQVIITNGERVASMAPASGMVVAGKDRVLQLTLACVVADSAPALGEPLRSPLLKLPNPCGLHARPAAILAAQAKTFSASIQLLKGATGVNAKSVVAILGLGANAGDLLQIEATGADAEQAVQVLGKLLGEGCGEDLGAAPAPAITAELAVPAAGANELAGLPAAPGFAVGRVFQVRPEPLEVSEQGQDPDQERARLQAALAEATLQIEAIKILLPHSGKASRAEILSAHQEFLADPELIELAQAGITQGKSAAFAWRAAFQQQAATLERLDSALLRERAFDIRDVGRRVLTLLTGGAPLQLEVPPDCILIAEELTPSETAQLDRTRVLGLCTTPGGPTGHVAILAGALGIPAICGIDPAALLIPDQTLVLLDGGKGILRRDPGEQELIQAMERIGQQASQRSLDRESALKPAITADGYPIEVAANIRNVQDAREAVAAGADGVGLLRSEFLFHDRDSAPSEDDQAAEYCTVARILGPGRRLVVRTLDVGGDKPLAYLPLAAEANPFLGLRGVRVSLEHPQIFRTQLRALLRSAPLGDLHIMFPMISTLEELRSARQILQEEAQALGRSAKVGVMVEVPSAAMMADALAREADFFSIGTNDLTQYCLAMDRGNPKLAKQADALHPAVLKLIALTVEGAHRHGKWVGVCGALASDLLAVPVLMGLGIDELSVNVPAISAIKARICQLRKDDCETLARELLQMGTAAEVRARLLVFNQ